MLMARLRHLPAKQAEARVAELLEQFDLVEAAKKPLATYSGGMTRRLDLAMTLITRPQVLFLDEPTTGLDPRSRHTMWDIVRGIVADGTTVLLTTQYLDEADELADRVAVLDRGTIVAEGTLGRAEAQGVRRAPAPAVRRRARPEGGRGPVRRVDRRTTPRSRSRFRPRAASAPCATCSTGSTPRASRSTTSPSTPPTSTTCSSPSPGGPAHPAEADTVTEGTKS